MPGQQQPLTADPVDLVAALNLTTGQRYLVQARAVSDGPQYAAEDGISLVGVTEAAARPSDLSVGQRLKHLDRLVVKPDAANGIWFWLASSRAAVLAVEVGI